MGTVHPVSDLEPRDAGGPPADPRDLRCSDSDMEQVAEIIRQGAADGRLTLDELDERLDRVYSARTYRELEPVVRDLPGVLPPGVPRQANPIPTPGTDVVPADGSRVVGLPVAGTSNTQNAVAIFSEAKRTGVWLVPADFASVAVFGSVELDLRDAQLAAPNVQIQANAVFGGVVVIAPDDVTVSALGTPVFGEYSGPHEEPVAGKPHIAVTGLALFGSVEVKRKTRKRRRS